MTSDKLRDMAEAMSYSLIEEKSISKKKNRFDLKRKDEILMAIAGDQRFEELLDSSEGLSREQKKTRYRSLILTIMSELEELENESNSSDSNE